MRKIFTDFPLEARFELNGADARHVLVVLRHGVGDRIAVTDSTGTTYACRIDSIAGHSAVLTVEERLSCRTQEQGKVVLAAGILKNDKFEWLIQKSTELGVHTIIPVQMEHCVVKLNDNHRSGKFERWRRIAVEAAKQCGRDDVPIIREVMPFTELFQAYGTSRFVIPYERETMSLAEVCHEVQQGDVVLCIGPEGGFSPKEIAYAVSQAAWCRTVSLGKRILRAETAALASLSILMYERGF